ncbi:MAG: NADPH-dependent F420 reductase [Desulfurellaceae bacterium]|nr:NADPH-dependent F420 reductase [Desulfurellaceae bacterium]
MKIAILGGTGEQGPGLALRWALAGEEVIIGSRQKEKGERVAAELNQELGRPLLVGMDNPSAAAAADIVVLTVPYSAHVPTLESVKDQLQGKIFVDVSVPLDPDNARRVSMPPAGSASQEAQEILGEQVSVVCALQNISAHLLRDATAEIDCDVLVCGSPKEARTRVIELIAKLNINAIDVGPLEAASLIEPITALLIRLNIRNKVHSAGIRITGLPDA